MSQDAMQMVQVAHFRLEKIDAVTGAVVEVIEGGDGIPTVVSYPKESDHGNDDCSA